jgi:hypothetical protein
MGLMSLYAFEGMNQTAGDEIEGARTNVYLGAQIWLPRTELDTEMTKRYDLYS